MISVMYGKIIARLLHATLQKNFDNPFSCNKPLSLHERSPYETRTQYKLNNNGN